MERDEPVRHRGALVLRAETKGDPAAGLEAAELSSELVALLLSKTLDVTVEAGGQLHSRGGDQPLDLDLVASGGENGRHRTYGSRFFRDEVETNARRPLGRDPLRECARDRGYVLWRRDDVLVVGELAAREGDRAVRVPGQRSDSAVRDPERDLLAAIVSARETDPVWREKDRRIRATPGQLGPFGLERCRIARDTDRVRRGEDHPSLGERRLGGTCAPRMKLRG